VLAMSSSGSVKPRVAPAPRPGSRVKMARGNFMGRPARQVSSVFVTSTPRNFQVQSTPNPPDRRGEREVRDLGLNRRGRDSGTRARHIQGDDLGGKIRGDQLIHSRPAGSIPLGAARLLQAFQHPARWPPVTGRLFGQTVERDIRYDSADDHPGDGQGDDHSTRSFPSERA